MGQAAGGEEGGQRAAHHRRAARRHEPVLRRGRQRARRALLRRLPWKGPPPFLRTKSSLTHHAREYAACITKHIYFSLGEGI